VSGPAVTVNGSPRRLAPGATGAVAVNAAVVPRSTWAATPLAEGDRIELLTAAQGG
jgi:sulfur carrier protein